jgi:hypothetical protein
VKVSGDVSDGESTRVEMLNVVVEAIRQAVGELPSARKWSRGMSGPVTAENHISVVNPLILVPLSQVDALKLAYRLYRTADICPVAVTARMTPEMFVPAANAE